MMPAVFMQNLLVPDNMMQQVLLQNQFHSLVPEREENLPEDTEVFRVMETAELIVQLFLVSMVQQPDLREPGLVFMEQHPELLLQPTAFMHRATWDIQAIL